MPISSENALDSTFSVCILSNPTMKEVHEHYLNDTNEHACALLDLHVLCYIMRNDFTNTVMHAIKLLVGIYNTE